MAEEKSIDKLHSANQSDLLRKHILNNFELKMTFYAFVNIEVLADIF